MAVSPAVSATITSLTASPATDGISLSVEFSDPHAPNGLPYLLTDAIEYWASQTNDLATATKVAEGFTAAKHPGGLAGATWYYWARARQASGQRWGDYFPVSATAGVSAVVYSDSEAWVFYVPTVTAGTGTLTSASGSGVYKRIGKTVFVRVAIEITTNGSGATCINFTLPFLSNGDRFVGSGMRGPDISCGVLTTPLTDLAVIYRYDGAYPGGDNVAVRVVLTYEVD